MIKVRVLCMYGIFDRLNNCKLQRAFCTMKSLSVVDFLEALIFGLSFLHKCTNCKNFQKVSSFDADGCFYFENEPDLWGNVVNVARLTFFSLLILFSCNVVRCADKWKVWERKGERDKCTQGINEMKSDVRDVDTNEIIPRWIWTGLFH